MENKTLHQLTTSNNLKLAKSYIDHETPTLCNGFINPNDDDFNQPLNIKQNDSK